MPGLKLGGCSFEPGDGQESCRRRMEGRER